MTEFKTHQKFGRADFVLHSSHLRFAEIVTRQVSALCAEFGWEGPFELRCSAEYTAGITEVNTPMGPVRVIGVLGGPHCFELREAK